MLEGDYTQWIGQVYKVNNYNLEVINVLAEGGYALVFTVAWEGKPYALKMQLVNNLEMLDRLKLEIRTLERMKGKPNIVPYIDSVITKKGNDVWEALMLFELCQGLTVSKLIMSKPDKNLSIEEINNIFLSVVKALAALHHHNPPITHRDIKIENIIPYRENYVLCDFGSVSEIFMDPTKCDIQKLQADVEKFTTIPYRSPEMVDLYNGKLISTKCDIWALGCLLYILFYNTTPFGESLTAIQTGVIKFPQDPAIPKGYRDLIKFMLDTDPDTRPHISEVAKQAFKLANLPCPIETEPEYAIVPKSSVKVVSDTRLTIQTSPLLNTKHLCSPIATSFCPRVRPRSRWDNLINISDQINTSISPSSERKIQNNAVDTVFNEEPSQQFLDRNNLFWPTINSNLETDIFGQKAFSVENNDSNFLSVGSTSLAKNSQTGEIICDNIFANDQDIFGKSILKKSIASNYIKSSSVSNSNPNDQIFDSNSSFNGKSNLIESNNDTNNKSYASKIVSVIHNKFDKKKNIIEL